MTYTGQWGPVVDGVTIPEDPESMLAAGKVNPSIDAVAFGAQTLDDFLEVYPKFLDRSGELE